MDRIAPHSDDDDDDQGDLAVPGDGGDQLQPDPEDTGLLPVPPLLVGCAGDDVAHKEKEYLSGFDFFKFFYTSAILYRTCEIHFLYICYFFPDIYILIQSDYIFFILLTQTFVTCTMQKVL